MKKIMIIGAGVYQMPLIETAKARGLFTVAVSPEGPYPGIRAADKVYSLDVRDEERILEAARLEGIDGVVTDQTDLAVRTVAYVAENMGLPGIGYGCARLFTDKLLMRRRCRELGLPVIEHILAESVDDAERFLEETGGPVMVKPVDNQGSRGIARACTAGELRDGYAEASSFSRSGRVIVEKYIDGREFEVDSIVAGGRSKILMCGDVIPFSIPGLFAAKERIYPADQPDEVLVRLMDTERRIVSGFGLRSGLTHSEYMMDGDGTIYLIESAARGGGSFISSDIARLQTGVDTSEFLISTALGETEGLPDFESSGRFCAYSAFYLPEGRIVSVEGVDEAAGLPFLRRHFLNDIKAGMVTEDFTDKTSRYINVLTAGSREELRRNMELLRETLKIRIRTERGIEGPVWD